MKKTNTYADSVLVGIIQTTLSAEAWKNGCKSAPRVSYSEDVKSWKEICRAMRAFRDEGLKPQIVVIPELSLPRSRIPAFEQICAELNVIAITGVDYHCDFSDRTVRNEGLVVVPRGFLKGVPSKSCVRYVFGKENPAPKEKEGIESYVPQWSWVGDHKVYLFDLHDLGRVGVSICYDFMDIERALMYRGEVHHHIVLAYNRDLNMFNSLASSLSRVGYSNVVICNCGYWGGSLAVSPYKQAEDRTLYSQIGKNLFASQVFRLPVSSLEDIISKVSAGLKLTEAQKELFKQPPPGLKRRFNSTP